MKNQFKLGIIYLLLGAFFICLCFAFPEVGLFYGLAGASIGPGIMMVYKHRYWSKRPTEYEEMIENQNIELNDERKEMIRGKAARVSILIIWSFLSLLIITAAFLGEFQVISEEISKFAVQSMAAFMVLFYLVPYFTYKYLSKKF